MSGKEITLLIQVFDVGDIYPPELLMLRRTALLEVLLPENSSADNDL